MQRSRLRGRTQLHNKDYMVQNLIEIDEFGSLKDWIQEVSHAPYWDQLVRCLIDSNESIPEKPDVWPLATRAKPPQKS